MAKKNEQPLTLSTTNRDSSSAGASRIDCISPWGLSPFRLIEAGTTDFSCRLFFPTSSHAGGLTVLVGFHFFGTSDRVILPEAVVGRLLCHALVRRLPEKGLGEALASLTEMVRFYSEPEPVPRLPEPTRWVPVQMGETVKATVHPVTEE